MAGTRDSWLEIGDGAEFLRSVDARRSRGAGTAVPAPAAPVQSNEEPSAQSREPGAPYTPGDLAAPEPSPPQGETVAVDADVLLASAEVDLLEASGAASGGAWTCPAEGPATVSAGRAGRIAKWRAGGREANKAWTSKPTWSFFEDEIQPFGFLGRQTAKANGLHKDVIPQLARAEAAAQAAGVILPSGLMGYRFQMEGRGGRHPRGQAFDLQAAKNPHVTVGGAKRSDAAGRLRYAAIYALTGEWMELDGGVGRAASRIAEAHRSAVQKAAAAGVEAPAMAAPELERAMAPYHRLVELQRRLKSEWQGMAGAEELPCDLPAETLEALHRSLLERVDARLVEDRAALDALGPAADRRTLVRDQREAAGRVRRLEADAKRAARRKPKGKGKDRGKDTAKGTAAAPPSTEADDARAAELAEARNAAESAAGALRELGSQEVVRNELGAKVAGLAELSGALSSGAPGLLTMTRVAQRPKATQGRKGKKQAQPEVPAAPPTVQKKSAVSNPSLEQLGSTGFTNLGEGLVEALVAAGWTWGGSWTGNHDAMHFEYPAGGAFIRD